MPNNYFEKITIGTFFAAIHDLYDITYEAMALELGCASSTIRHWRKGESAYSELAAGNYEQLFSLFETSNDRENLIRYTSLFNRMGLESLETTENMKKIIRNSLRYHYDLQVNKNTRNMEESIDFLTSCLKNETKQKKIKSVDMAFHSGWNWVKYTKKRKFILQELIKDRGINIRVLVNDDACIKNIAQTMSNPDDFDFYTSFDNVINQWNELSQNTEKFNLRISPFPIMRRVFIVTYSDGQVEAMVRHYAYNFWGEIPSCAKIYLDDNDYYLDVFKNEFEYLWENAQSYDEWNSNKRVPDEL